eukprot:6182158-Pleurochrysis_carterae.AAC.1
MPRTHSQVAFSTPMYWAGYCSNVEVTSVYADNPAYSVSPRCATAAELQVVLARRRAPALRDALKHFFQIKTYHRSYTLLPKCVLICLPKLPKAEKYVNHKWPCCSLTRIQVAKVVNSSPYYNWLDMDAPALNQAQRQQKASLCLLINWHQRSKL